MGNRESQSGFQIAPAHFVERHGLVIIVAIGESVVAGGIGAAGLAVDAELVIAAVLGLLLSAGLWWAYFGADDDEQAERGAEQRPGRGASRGSRWRASGWRTTACCSASSPWRRGSRRRSGTPTTRSTTAEALALGGGVALFLAADVGFRRVLGLGRAAHRTIAALLALATIPLGTEIAAAAQLAALGRDPRRGAGRRGRHARAARARPAIGGVVRGASVCVSGRCAAPNSIIEGRGAPGSRPAVVLSANCAGLGRFPNPTPRSSATSTVAEPRASRPPLALSPR